MKKNKSKNSRKKKAPFQFKDRSGKTHGAKTQNKHTVVKKKLQIKLESRSPAIKLKAKIDKNQRGFGFLVFESKSQEDLFIPPHEAERFFQNDRVEVTLSNSKTVLNIRFLEHGFFYLVGRYSPNHGKKKQASGWLIYEHKNHKEEVFIPSPPPEVKDGDWIKILLTFSNQNPRHSVIGTIEKIFGPTLPASADIDVVSCALNLKESHSEAAINEAKAFENELNRSDFSKRLDLTSMDLITIDGKTARDFDDAVYVEKKNSGYTLWVAIADVSHYVTEGSALNDEAYSRGTSVYFPEKAFHMLPKELSENLCSLRPNLPRLALTAKIEFSKDGKKLSTEIFESIIQSKRRATYEEIESEKNDPKHKNLFELYRILKKIRHERGSIDFDLPEVEILVDENGEPTVIKRRERLDAHRLIEEFMIAANESVTEWVLEKKYPFIFRIHETPASEALERFLKLCKTIGLSFQLKENEVTPMSISKIVQKIENNPASLLLNSALLRSMRQAIYSSTHSIHFGLASTAYTHFTSPIRRYPDLIVHRIIKSLINKTERKDIKKLEIELDKIAEHTSRQERLATEAERESHKIKQVRLMLKHLGDEFEGTIVGMIDRGMFAQLDDPFVEGMISRDTLNDDFYEFNEDRMIFFGKRKRRTFKIGQRVKVKVLNANLERRQVDFALIDPTATD